MDEFDWFEALPAGHRSGFVAVIGKPNAGKSTLVNHFLGQKIAIVSPKPQTTRTRIMGILTHTDAQAIFLDTPGIHAPLHALGEAMVDTAINTIPDADVVLFVVDASQVPGDEDRSIARTIRNRTQHPVILALNKMDLLAPNRVTQHTEAYLELVPECAGWMLISATEGANLDELLASIVAQLPEGPRYYPDTQITDQTEREIAAELIREQVLRLTHQEVPHAVAVTVEEFKERENDVVYVAATIHVERSSQKGIVIGKGGHMLRQIGSAARPEIERMVNGRVYLELWVKVNKNWRRDTGQVARLGYTPPDR
ncbi:MAG: GTPase Era [Anaerolineae bacterium]|nr:GTPase Era [Anaerolineae bacterium]